MRKSVYLPVFFLLGMAPTSHASTAYGSLCNFDAINDTEVEAHGFEIEIEDVRSTALQYTYDYNHYGAPDFVEDLSNPLHPKTVVRYASKKDSNGHYLSYTAVPAGPFPPTQGHQCTNPAVNEGCEHFGVSYSTNAKVHYYWLIDNPAAPGTLIRGPEVTLSAPSWSYQPPAPNKPAEVVAVIPAPEEPAPAKEFGKASWVKVIKTQLHNNKHIPLNDLISADKDNDGKADWTNGEVAQVETEWYLLQKNIGKNKKKLKLPGAAEPLQNGDEKITKRYEFYTYAGGPRSIDGETGEAMCDKVGKDNLHGSGTVDVTDAFGNGYLFNCSKEVVVGDYTGAQMVGFEVVAPLGLVEHLQDGKLNQAYVKRRLVVGGNTPYSLTKTGALPRGLSLNATTGILSGTPKKAGQYTFTVSAKDADQVLVERTYTLTVLP